MIDLSKYVLPGDLPIAQITDAADIEVLEKLQFEGKPCIAKLVRARTVGETVFNETYCLLMAYVNMVNQKGFVGAIGTMGVAITADRQAWEILMFEQNG